MLYPNTIFQLIIEFQHSEGGESNYPFSKGTIRAQQFQLLSALMYNPISGIYRFCQNVKLKRHRLTVKTPLDKTSRFCRDVSTAIIFVSNWMI